MKTLEQYIAERREVFENANRFLSENRGQYQEREMLNYIQNNCAIHMPRVLDMLEENRRISKIILNDPTVPDHVKFFLNESNKDLEKMVNE